MKVTAGQEEAQYRPQKCGLQQGINDFACPRKASLLCDSGTTCNTWNCTFGGHLERQSDLARRPRTEWQLAGGRRLRACGCGASRSRMERRWRWLDVCGAVWVYTTCAMRVSSLWNRATALLAQCVRACSDNVAIALRKRGSEARLIAQGAEEGHFAWRTSMLRRPESDNRVTDM